MFPTVQINSLNMQAGETKEIERCGLFVGVITAKENQNKLLSITPDSDLDKLLGSQESELKKQLKTAMLNAGQNWLAYALPTAEEGYDFKKAYCMPMKLPRLNLWLTPSPKT